MSLTKEEKLELISKFGGSETNTGSTEVQIALFTKRINELTEHFKIHTKDHNSRRGMLKLIGQRRKLLKYLKRTDLDKYRELIKELGLRK
ncbi:MAG: 30S ribosomal protein S15 [Spirochaetia bacterium]|nr:30S ribosomal protein S15 [Spirochaetia bacterium]MBR4436559.1 30S ribosomal protein S15 [Spirochaetales bacterium]MBO7517180.1 30S ribosomal protein S15 [Spirochaetia bacterium]MBP5739765.1 30S ribosomal protein S15 [Spirochaetia bacterium]MBR4158917.1 30S ribosomal protein S15 [Spirochaetia bacterium]